MALNLDIDNVKVTSALAWTGGDCTFAFWMRKLDTTIDNVCGILADSTGGLSTAQPRWRVATSSGSFVSSQLVNASGSPVSSSPTETYSTTQWTHILVEFDSTGPYSGAIQTYVNGVGAGSFSSSSNVSGVDVFQFGTESTSECDAHIAHFALWNRLLSADQKTALLTTLPSGVSGGAPEQYCPFLTDALNYGSGGSTYDFTLTNATIASTYDSSLPTLGEGGSTSNTRNSGRMMLGIG